MIDRTLSNSMSVADLAPKAATKLSEPSRGDGGFGEALAGAHSVHDRRESHAASHSRSEWAHGDRTIERSRGTDRADEVRNEASTSRGDRAEDVDEHTVTATGDAAPADDVDPDTDAEHVAADADAAVDTATDPAAGPQVTVALAVAAAPVSTDLDAIVAPTTTAAAAATATDAVDAAMRLAIDADGTAVVVDPDAAVDADAQLVLAQGAEDAETGDVKGPTRPLTSAPATTSGPSPVQLGAAVEVDAAAGDVPVVTAQTTQQAALAATVEVAEGGEADAAAVQLVQAAAVEADGEAVDDDAAVQTVAAKAAAAAAAAVDGEDVAVVADEAEVPGATGRANATTHVQNPTALAQVQANAQAQAKATERAAEDGGDTAAPAKLEPLPSQAQPLTAAARDAQLATGMRIREAMLGGDVQDRIDTIADQLATRLRLSQAAGGSQVQLSLKPRELGEVTVQMNVREGVVAATILVDKADTLRTLQTNVEELKRSLENQGLTIQEFSVDVRGDAGAGGANARAAADLRGTATRTSSGSASSVAGAAAVIPGLSGDREVDADAIHDGDVSVLA